MKKITAFVGTQTKRATYQAVQEFEKNLGQLEEIDFEYVFLCDYHLEFCRGCMNCLNKGEELCPLKDDRDVLLAKIEQSDGIVLATPNYAFQVSALMKNFLDRFAYFYHRPKFFSKTCTAIVTQGIFGGNKIRKYLETMGRNFGFQVTKGSCLTTWNPMTEPQKKRLTAEMKKAAERFHAGLAQPFPPPPSLARLMIFRMHRASIMALDEGFRDYRYFKEMGWFESDYYYDTELGPVKKTAGHLFDVLGKMMARLM
jgi:NAD(P)H-dependent FMN reductase